MLRRRQLLRALPLVLAGAGVRRGSAAQRPSRDGLVLREVVLGPAPALPVRSMSGRVSSIERELDGGGPLILNFVFTTCSSTCSLQTAMLAELQRHVRAKGGALRLVSVTIDPDNDTPEQLRRFAGTFGVGEGWNFFTGRFDDLLRLQRHFDVYRGSKVAHPPVVLMRGDSRSPWLRVEGFPTAKELLALLDVLPAR